MPATISTKLGPRTFEVAPLPWGELRKLMGSINRVAIAAASGTLDEACMDELAQVVCTGLRLPLAEFDGIHTDLVEVLHAFNTVVKVSGLEQVLGEALRAARATETPSLMTLTPGTASTPT
jgi:hypothetical protein